MLDMGFMPEIQKMVENEDMPKKAPEGQRQTLMFSALLTALFLPDCWILLDLPDNATKASPHTPTHPTTPDAGRA